MAAATQQFSCVACGRKHTWRQELAGKRGKCKCGVLIDIPAHPESEPDEGEYDLADLAQDAERAVADLPPTVVEAPPPPPREKRRSPKTPKDDPPSRVSRRGDDDVLIDKNRDIIAPVVLSLVGALLLIGFYEFRYNLPVAALGTISIVLSISIAVESVILLVLGLIIAGPLGVSFGDIRTAWYKFAAIVIFADATGALTNAWIARIAPGFGSGILGFSLIGLPVAAAVYWTTMTYLFSMDPNDSWLAVCVLAVLYRVSSVVLLVLLLAIFLRHSGVAGAATGLPSFGGAPPPDPLVDEIEHAKDLGLLEEARQYIAKRSMFTDRVYVEGWYAAGAKNVWYEVSRDFNGHGTPFRMVVELPADAAARATCFQIAGTYFDDRHMGFMKSLLHDTGQPYLLVHMPMQ
jgi:hypothetical protein